MADSRNQLLVRITAKDEATSVLRKIQNEVGSMGSRIKGALGALGTVVPSLAGIASLGGLAVGIKNAVGALDDLADTAEGLGTTAVALAELRSKAAEAIACWNWLGGWAPERLPAYLALHGAGDIELLTDLLIVIRDHGRQP